MYRMVWFATNFVGPYFESGVTQGQRLKVLEVGSYDDRYNGAYRGVFSDGRIEYTGLDMVPGPSVDLVLPNPYDWSTIPDDHYDVVISGQAFEHIEFFWVTLAEMVRVLKPNGLMCIIAPAAYDEHRHPVDCYRFSTDAMVAMANYTGLKILHAHTNCAPAKGTPLFGGNRAAWYGTRLVDSILIAEKPYAGGIKFPDLSTYKCTPLPHEALRSTFVPYHSKNIFRRLCNFICSLFV